MSVESLSDEGWASYAATGVLDGATEVELVDDLPQEAAVERDPRLCIGNDQTCKSYKAKGTQYCAGHLKGIARLKKHMEVHGEQSGDEDSGSESD